VFSPCISSDDVGAASLPTAVAAYVAAQYPGASVLQAERYDAPSGTAYGLRLSDGTHLLVQSNGTLVASGTYTNDVDVAIANLPQSVRDYIAANYPQLAILRAELETEYGFRHLELYLSDDTVELYFTPEGVFVCADTRHGGGNDDGPGDDNGGNGGGNDDGPGDDNGGNGGGNDDGPGDDNGGNGGGNDDGPGDDNGGNGGGTTSTTLPPNALAYLQANYPGYAIQVPDREDWCGNTFVIEVELEVHQGEDIHVYFDLTGNFLFTGVERPTAALPTAVSAGLRNSYPNYVFGEAEAEHLTLADGSLQYVIKIRPTPGSGKIRVLADANGGVVCVL
jgi:hypothetical protein